MSYTDGFLYPSDDLRIIAVLHCNRKKPMVNLCIMATYDTSRILKWKTKTF